MSDTSPAAAAWDRDPFACAVTDALAADFPDLRDPVVAGIVRKHVYAHARTGRGLEVILDSPLRADWRLVSARDARIRVGCWKADPSGADRERAERLNAVLETLDGQRRAVR
jgi:hypothetical protein